MFYALNLPWIVKGIGSREKASGDEFQFRLSYD